MRLMVWIPAPSAPDDPNLGCVRDAEVSEVLDWLQEQKVATDHCLEHGPLIEAIERWAQAYPLEAFPEPDHKATGHNPTLCSASMGRHVIGRLMEYVDVKETK